MLQRKQSVTMRNDLVSMSLGDYNTQITNATDDSASRSLKFLKHKKLWSQRIIKIFSLLSFISICANTPETIGNSSLVFYTIFTIDLLCSLIFTIEMCTKIMQKGLMHNENSYVFDHWSQFDFMLVLAHWLSVAIEIIEITNKQIILSYMSYLNILRCPRPLVLVRLIRAFFKFRLPKNRINSILQ
jgi:hypothetical protein